LRHKGKVESGVKYVKNNALKARSFTSLDEQQRFLEHWEGEPLRLMDVRRFDKLGGVRNFVQRHEGTFILGRNRVRVLHDEPAPAAGPMLPRTATAFENVPSFFDERNFSTVFRTCNAIGSGKFEAFGSVASCSPKTASLQTSR
jgi:hypothetical protein